MIRVIICLYHLLIQLQLIIPQRICNLKYLLKFRFLIQQAINRCGVSIRQICFFYRIYKPFCLGPVFRQIFKRPLPVLALLQLHLLDHSSVLQKLYLYAIRTQSIEVFSIFPDFFHFQINWLRKQSHGRGRFFLRHIVHRRCYRVGHLFFHMHIFCFCRKRNGCRLIRNKLRDLHRPGVAVYRYGSFHSSQEWFSGKN